MTRFSVGTHFEHFLSNVEFNFISFQTHRSTHIHNINYQIKKAKRKLIFVNLRNVAVAASLFNNQTILILAIVSTTLLHIYICTLKWEADFANTIASQSQKLCSSYQIGCG